MIALPVLVAAGAAIGTTRQVMAKQDHGEYPILWGVIVAKTGCRKSPALDKALDPIREIEDQWVAEDDPRQERYKTELLVYKKDLKAWEKDGGIADPPNEPSVLPVRRLVVSDITVEALAPKLLDNPRGLRMAKDELAGWFESFGRYSSNRSGDKEQWLEMYGGRRITVDRKSKETPPIRVPRAAVSVCGTIQPSVLERMLTDENRENGFAARFLFAYPPDWIAGYSDYEIPSKVKKEFRATFERLTQFRHKDGTREPQKIPLSPEAKAAYRCFMEYTQLIMQKMDPDADDLRAAWEKLRGCVLRMALIIHCLRDAEQDCTLKDSWSIDVESFNAARSLVEWFGNEAARAYGLFAESEDDRTLRMLEEWIERHGGNSTIAKINRSGPRMYRGKKGRELAREHIAALLSDGRVEWVIPRGPQDGRPKECFRLVSGGSGHETADSGVNTEGFVSVSSAAKP